MRVVRRSYALRARLASSGRDAVGSNADVLLRATSIAGVAFGRCGRRLERLQRPPCPDQSRPYQSSLRTQPGSRRTPSATPRLAPLAPRRQRRQLHPRAAHGTSGRGSPPSPPPPPADESSRGRALDGGDRILKRRLDDIEVDDHASSVEGRSLSMTTSTRYSCSWRSPSGGGSHGIRCKRAGVPRHRLRTRWS